MPKLLPDLLLTELALVICGLVFELAGYLDGMKELMVISLWRAVGRGVLSTPYAPP